MADGGHFENEIFFKFHLICLAGHATLKIGYFYQGKSIQFVIFPIVGQLDPFGPPMPMAAILKIDHFLYFKITCIRYHVTHQNWLLLTNKIHLMCHYYDLMS